VEVAQIREFCKSRDTRKKYSFIVISAACIKKDIFVLFDVDIVVEMIKKVQHCHHVTVIVQR